MSALSKRILIIVASLAVLCVFVIVIDPYIRFYGLTGRFTPIRKIDKLRSPVTVIGWSQEGLQLADGRTLQLPGFRRLPEKSDALSHAIRSGVDIDSTGRVYGLIHIAHTCGNDPVREHVARVDIANLLTFLGEGEITFVRENGTLGTNHRTFTSEGWYYTDFLGFDMLYGPAR